MKYYAGLDVSMKRTNICVVDEADKIVLQTECETQPDDIAEQLCPFASSLDIVGLEAGQMCFWLVDELRKHNLPAVCLDSRQVANVLSTVINKTDKNDARGIAKILRSKFYTIIHQRSQKSIEIGLLMSIRSGLVSDRTRKKNRIRGVLKSYGIRIKSCGHQNFIDEVKNSITHLDIIVRETIELALEDYQSIGNFTSDIEKKVNKMQKTVPEVALLKDVPGVGDITALSFIAEIDDPNRFKKNPRKLGAYLGLTPRQYSSGDSVILGRISKSGSPTVRSLLYEAAVLILTRTKNWSKLKSWGLRLTKRMPFKQAAIAVARKLAVIMLKMLLTGESFRYCDPENKEEKKTKKKLPVSSKQLRTPILAEPPSSASRLPPSGLATLGLDSPSVCPA